jgi:hypothetical protein
MNLVRLGVIVTLLLSGQAMGDSLLDLMIEVGGDNRVADWENNLDTPYVAGSAANGQVFAVDEGTGLAIVTWDVVMALTGTHSDGNVPNGVANAVFDLELRDTQTGELIAIGRAANTTTDGDNPTGPGFFSTTNDGDDDGLRGTSFGADPLQNSAFTRSFAGSIGIAGPGRVWDQQINGGPRLDRSQYPSAAGYPAGSIAPNGKLVGIGAGYSLYTLIDDPRVPGVGGIGSCQLAVVPVAEGQIALEAGAYTLKVVPDTSNNILRGDFDCTIEEPRNFALPVDQATGSEITFIVAASPSLTSAVSRKTHGTAGDWDINVGAGDIECRSLQLGTANPNQLRIIASFDMDVAILGGSAAVTSDVGTVSNVVPGSVPNEVDVTITNLPLFGQVNLGFVNNPSSPTAGVVDANTPTDLTFASQSILCIRVVVGDYDNSARTTFLDFSKVKTAGYINQLVTDVDLARADFDCNGRPTFLDFSKVKNAGLINKTAAACP